MYQIKRPKLYSVEDYEKYVGPEVVDRIMKMATPLKGHHVVNVNSTYFGGGVAEILLTMTLLMNGLGLKTGWRTIHGRPEFFNITKSFHNALQGGKMNFTDKIRDAYEEVISENSFRTHLDSHNFVVIHDPQPLPMVTCYPHKGPWIWRCHIDMSCPHPKLWSYLKKFVNSYDAVIFSIPEYRQNVRPPQHFYMPAIDPFSHKNRKLSEREMKLCLDRYKIPTDKPIVTQVSRFDRWKDPEGVIKAFKIARKKVDCTLVLLGNSATDDPEGEKVFESLLDSREERILILPYGDDTSLVNTLQTKSDVVFQKSTREGFGLTVTEAMWKGTPVIGGKVGGIPYQIQDGENGFTVSSIQEAADRLVELIKNKALRESMGKKARQSVKENFLMTRLLEQYLKLFLSLKSGMSI
jgi:trehalose synthase